ncbi:sensor histidine kinase [Streptomonospora nanhaiensis]|uniref:sensor histidine kinase n=1 Tax=Streptomonospora nanhaiensis TaxID=1323731 RepID=UPI001C381D91|nr:histidine kinase [Streptomonospora nanhaiensis]MBV2366802.1 two-component sensor histidine kinase [Streptomonospora nanhaiensis]MBX9387704.1 two-component sensor histidine kinase [Streptomonospora nanhaiensis]
MTTRRRLTGLWRRFGAEAWLLPLLGAALSVASLVPSLQGEGTMLGGVPDRPFDALALVAIGLQGLPLTLCRRWPIAALALVALGFVVDQLLGYHTVAGTALPLALGAAAFYAERHRRATAAVGTVGYVVLALALSQVGAGESIAGWIAFYGALALSWGVGAWLRAVRIADAERRRRVAEETRTAERTRIARELHDVVTHHVTAMVVQAEAARYLTAAPERLDQTLDAITDTGRRAVTDLRHLLDLLNPDHGTGARTPPVGRVLTLVEQTRRSGQPVEFTEEGTPAASTGSADLVAFRIVQEGLTNALKYAHGARTSVRLRHGEGEITVEVETDGEGTAPGFAEGSGRGLAGLRERVEVLGGEFSAGPRAEGGFLVRGRIPAKGAA